MAKFGCMDELQPAINGMCLIQLGPRQFQVNELPRIYRHSYARYFYRTIVAFTTFRGFAGSLITVADKNILKAGGWQFLENYPSLFC